MYLLIAFNVLLDALAGCSSGGIRVKDEWDRNQSHMIHYRTLGKSSFSILCQQQR